MHFDLPELATLEVAAVTSAEEMAPHAHEEGDPHASDVRRADDATSPRFGATAEVRAERRVEQRGTNDYRLDRALLEAAPRADAADMLKSAPGLVVARIEGEAVGHRLMLRGFDATTGRTSR